MPPVWLMARVPYVTLDGVAKSRVVTGAGTAQACLATAWSGLAIAAAVFSGILAPPQAGAGLLLAAVTTAFLGWRFRRRVGGLTGDFLGAVEQASEVAFLLGLTLTRAGAAG